MARRAFDPLREGAVVRFGRPLFSAPLPLAAPAGAVINYRFRQRT